MQTQLYLRPVMNFVSDTFLRCWEFWASSGPNPGGDVFYFFLASVLWRPIDGQTYRRANLPKPYKFIGFGEVCPSIGLPVDRAP